MKMSETTLRNDISTESLCTVIENCTENNNHVKSTDLKEKTSHYKQIDAYNDDNDSKGSESGICDEESIRIIESQEDLRTSGTSPSAGLNNSLESNCDSAASGQDQVDNATTIAPAKPRSKLKKSVSFDPNDEKIRKFISGDPIVDQRNPFKGTLLNGGSATTGKKKKTPPPVPTKRSTLSVRKTVTQQLREREREKEKERERVKNETNNRKNTNTNTNTNTHTHMTNGGSVGVSSPDDFVTTEEVLKQSKYVRTYIKNPDPYFVYDPTVLARIKFEELRDIAEKKPPKKPKLTTQTRERLKELRNRPGAEVITAKPKGLSFKKCSKPNYPELADIKVRVGTEPDDNYFNPAEVTKNARKFDERVKKLHIGSDDDLDEIDEPLTKSESSDEVTLSANQNHTTSTSDHEHESTDFEQDTAAPIVMNGVGPQPEKRADGTFTNTIKSKEFQEYLAKKGLTLIPKKIPSGAQALYTNGSAPKANNHISFAPSPERVQISINRMEEEKNAKKPSVFQRLLSNSIFASRRRTTPKEIVPTPRHLYASDAKKDNCIVKTPSPIRRVVLERQSFHGRPRASNLLSASEIKDLKNQTERNRKSFASGDDTSISISSALTNAENVDGPDERPATGNPNPVVQARRAAFELQATTKPIAKPPRRTLSGDRLNNAQQMRPSDPQATLDRPRIIQGSRLGSAVLSLPRDRNEAFENAAAAGGEGGGGGGEPQFRRTTLERQSLIPRRTSAQASDRRQVFGRTSSMDRNEILKRTANRSLPGRSKSATGTLKSPPSWTLESKENLHEQFSLGNGPKLTSTPIREQARGSERRGFSSLPPPNIKKPPGVVYVDPQEWERLKAIKERTDKELYYRVLQQQQYQQQHQQQQQQQQRPEVEEIYERLPVQQIVVTGMESPASQQQRQLPATVNFVRGSPQRNTFSGVAQNRQMKIIDGRPIVAANGTVPHPVAANVDDNRRSQSVLDSMTLGAKGNCRRGYESENETPVILRRKHGASSGGGMGEQPRRIGGILTREEILQKVKEFCRKSLNKTPVNQPQMQAIYEKQSGSTDLSPVSYASVETHQRPGSRMYAAPQVPQRMQSLPQQFLPITHEVIQEQSGSNTPTPSPIYAHVIKRSSLQSCQSELYDSPPPRQYLVRRESDVQPVYVSRGDGSVMSGGTLQRPESACAPTQYVIVDSEKLSPAQVYKYYQADIYAQPQYIRPHQFQPVPGTYGYISVREPIQPGQQLRPRLLDGRSTPLILDRSSQQVSQIYWTPQNQRLQQHTGLMPVQISPRYTSKQPYPVPAPRYIQIPTANNTSNGPQFQSQSQSSFATSIPQQEKLSTVAAPRSNTPTKSLQRTILQQRQTLPSGTTTTKMGDYNAHQQHQQQQQNSYDWESGSEAGEVQRIMEQQNRNDTNYTTQ